MDINTQFKKNSGTCFWNVCHGPQNNAAHLGKLPTKPVFCIVEVYKRKSMDSRSFSEHKQKCPDRGENKVITVYQGGFLFQLEGFSMVYAFITAWHLRGMLRISRRGSYCGIRFRSSIRSCSRSWRVCGGTGRPRTLLSQSHMCLIRLRSGLTADHSISWISCSRKTAMVTRAT